MYGQDKMAACDVSAGRAGSINRALGAPAPQAQRPQQTLDSLIQNTIEFVQTLRTARNHSAEIRQRLVGAWPENPEACNDVGANGMLDALGAFQQDAWRTLRELQDNLAAIHAGLG